MSNENSNDPFAERLQKIEARKQQQREANPNYTDPSVVSRNSGSERRPALPMIVFGGGVLILLVGVAVLVSVLKQGVSEKLVAQVEQSTSGLAVKTQSAAVDGTAVQPAEQNPLFIPPSYRPYASEGARSTERDGYAFGAGYGVTATGQAVALNTIVADFQLTGPNSDTGEYAPFEMNTECALRPVGAGEKLVNVNIRRSPQYAPVQLLDDDDVLNTLLTVSKEKLEEGELFDNIKIARGAVRIVDVVVTDTEAPLYLVLQTFAGNTLWNITAAPGVEIAHVAMISSGDSAIAGLFESASFEAIAASDFSERTDFNYFKGDPSELECMLQPYTAPKDHWGGSIGAQEGNSIDGNFMFSQTNGFEVYSHWYTALLGEGPEVNLITAAEASAVLVGDLPIKPLAFIPLSDKYIHLPSHDIILAGTAIEREEETQQIYTEILVAAAGSDPSEIVPPASTFALPDPANPPVETEVAAPNSSLLGKLALSGRVQPKLTLVELNSTRRVSFEVYLELDDLLADGEEMPSDELQSLYTSLRAQRYMQRYCEDTLSAISSKCGMFKTNVHRVADRYQVRADFAYIPNYTIGPVDRTRGGGFMSAFLPDPNLENTYQTAEERQAFLGEILEVCDRIRAEFGNCLIGTAGFYLHKPARFSSSGVNANAASWVEIYALENPLEERKFQERAQEIYTEISGG